jgi:hypothetical protein
MIIENINDNVLYYNELENIHIREYYLLCVDIVKKIDFTGFNITFGNYYHTFHNDNKSIRLNIQFEHTLVKSDGRNSENSIKGNIKCDDDFYLVRIANYNDLLNYDIVVEYSKPNIKNISSVYNYQEYLKKVVYIAPIVYDYNKGNKEREINCITLFYDIYQPRRKRLLDKIVENGIDCYNVNNCFNSDDLRNLYLNTKILLNIRQTDHHHTFEELRVLPALLNGVLVISEDVPLRDEIPYNKFIIWCEYGTILDKLKEVENDYEYYWDNIFSGDDFNNMVESLKDSNYKNMSKIINEIK